MHLLEHVLSDLTSEDLRQAVVEHGAILLRSGSDLDDFLNFSQDCTDVWGAFIVQGENSGEQRTVGGNSGRKVVYENKSLFTTTGQYEGHAVPLHGELYFQQRNVPQLLWFYCHKEPLSGGETLLCDGLRIFADLPSDIQNLLSTHALVYERQHDRHTWPKLYGISNPQELSSWLIAQGYSLSWTEEQSLMTRFKSPALVWRNQQAVFINNLLPFAFRQIYHAQETRARVYFEGEEEPVSEAVFKEIDTVVKKYTEAIIWQPGDIALVDNTRVLHGRNAVTDTQRQIYVRMGYAAFLDSSISA